MREKHLRAIFEFKSYPRQYKIAARLNNLKIITRWGMLAGLFVATCDSWQSLWWEEKWLGKRRRGLNLKSLSLVDWVEERARLFIPVSSFEQSVTTDVFSNSCSVLEHSAAACAAVRECAVKLSELSEPAFSSMILSSNLHLRVSAMRLCGSTSQICLTLTRAWSS